MRLCSFAPGQTPTPVPSPKADSVPTFDELWKAYPTTDTKIVITDDSGVYSLRSLRNDYKLADVVAYIDIKAKKLINHTEGADCDNDNGAGYCAYRLSGEIKEIYKGKGNSKTIEFVATSDADYPKKYFLGEKVVFLIRSEEGNGNKSELGTLENSTRSIRHNVIEKLRSIKNPSGPIDETDETDPYSKISIEKNYNTSDVVILADVISFTPYKDELGFEPFIVTARVKEVFKGSLKSGQTIRYTEDLLYRPLRAEDLGVEVIYLKLSTTPTKYVQIDTGTKKGDKPKRTERYTNPDNIPFEKIEYTEGHLIHGILEKLRAIRSKKQ